MKVKPAPKNAGIQVELSHQETQIPGQSVPAFNLKKILVPTDFSDCSNKALQYAIPFAKQFGAELFLLYVVDVTPLAPEIGFIEAQGIPDHRQRLLSLQQSIGNSVRSNVLLRSGAAYSKIAEAAAECQANLIIISTHGRTGLSRVMLGSTTERVVRHAPCPVLIVRETEHDFVPAQSGHKTGSD